MMSLDGSELIGNEQLVTVHEGDQTGCKEKWDKATVTLSAAARKEVTQSRAVGCVCKQSFC